MPNPAPESVVRPASLAELRHAVEAWNNAAFGRDTPVQLSRQGRVTGVWLRARQHRNFRVRLDAASILRLSHRRKALALDLKGFDFAAELEPDNVLLITVKAPRAGPSALDSTLREAAASRHQTLLVRWLRLFQKLEAAVPQRELRAAEAAPTDFSLAVQALGASSLASEVAAADPLAAARLRGLGAKQELIVAGGGLLTAEQVAGLLGVTRQAVDKRRATGNLLALTQGRRGYQYPGFQFIENGTLPGLGKVLKAIRGLDPWMKLVFFVAPNDRLADRPPVDALLAGDVEGVLRAAAALGEQGAA